MKETDFIHQNKQKWRELEDQIKAKRSAKDHKHLADNFVRLSDDLSYAQTYYPRRTVRVYLNALAQKVYKKVFNARTKDKSKRGRFWTHELPTALWEARIELIIALIAFLVAAFIGVVSSKYDNSFAEQILGSGYVNMTEENIAKGDPMGVYKQMDALPMFFRIMYNNLQVSAFTFILGILLGIGTLGIIFKNGVMLGVFQYFFFQKSLGFVSILTIWQHGTIEIASIVVAGGAGLVLGKSIVFPGTLPRGISLKFGFLKGLKILLGVAPLIVLAAFFESFYTRFDDLPDALRIITILASIVFVVGYYVVLPFKRGRKISLLKDVEENYGASHVEYRVDYNQLKNNGEILSDSLIIVQQNLPKFLFIGFIPALFITLISLTVSRDAFSDYLYFSPLENNLIVQLYFTFSEVANRLEMLGLYFSFSNKSTFYFWPVLALVLTWISAKSSTFILKLIPPVGDGKTGIKSYVLFFFIHFISLAPFYLSLWYGIVYIAFVWPILSIVWFVHLQEKGLISKHFFSITAIVINQMLKHIGLIVISVLFGLLVMLLVQSPVLFLAFQLANDFIGFTDSKAMYFVEFAIIFVSVFTLFCSATFISINALFNFRSMKEILTAHHLKAEIESISLKKSFYGTPIKK